MRIVSAIGFALGVIVVAAPATCQADVINGQSNGFQIKIERTIDASPGEVYGAVVDRIGQWWSDSHTFSADASNLSLEARPGGFLIERLPDGGFVRHLEVVHVATESRLVLSGGLGPLQDQGVAGSMAWSFSPTDDGNCLLVVTYNVGGFVPGGLDAWSKPVDGVLTEQVDNLIEFLAR